MRLPIHAFLAFVFSVCCAVAQPDDLGYEPPAGWTYVMNLDSVDVLGIHIHNDTVVLSGESRRMPAPDKGRLFALYSLNGGSTWDTLHQEKYNENVGYLGTGFFPNSNRIYRLLREQDPATLVQLVSMRISYDLGKTFPERYDYDTLLSQVLIGTNRRMHFHPLAPDEGFYVRGQNSIFYDVFRTHDGGKTWQHQPMPPPRDGRGVYYQILPDVRNPRVWNAWVNGADHSFVDDFYQTRDDGKSFSYIDQWGEYGGIGYAGEVRSWWKSHYYSTIGIVSTGDKGDSVKIPWLKSMAPGKPDPDFDNGYHYTLVNDNYKYLEKMPDTSIIVVREVNWKKPNDTITDYRTYMYRTYNDGETWESIWPTYLDIYKIFLDQSTKTLWLVTNDSTAKQMSQNFPPKHRLYRQQVFTSVEDEPDNKNFIDNISISPNPAESFITLQYISSTYGKVEINLYDLTGAKVRTIYSGWQDMDAHSILWNIPGEIAKGMYFIKIESRTHTAIHKLLIQ